MEKEIKESILKFINITMRASTEGVARKFSISKDEAYEILNEMVLHDGTIKNAGILSKENMDNIIWMKI